MPRFASVSLFIATLATAAVTTLAA
ncbi:MAG: hypothetical protein QOF60_29, partial [Actinomycetota bacterium]|nr:hypothetical protein [Actinomycetota bacterium]